MAQSRHHDRAEPCPLSGVKRTLRGHAPMSAYDPSRTFVGESSIHRWMAAVFALIQYSWRPPRCEVGVLTFRHFLRGIAISCRSITSPHAFVLPKNFARPFEVVVSAISLHDPRRFAFLDFSWWFCRLLRFACLGIRHALTSNSYEQSQQS